MDGGPIVLPKHKTGMYDIISDKFLSVLLLLSLFVTFIKCNNKSINKERYKLLPKVVSKEKPTRKYKRIKYDKIISISGGENYELFDLKGLSVGKKGGIYVADYGDMKVKRFSSKGEYMTNYGNGIGRGPRQVLNIIDSGIIKDSIVYTLGNKNSRLNIFSKGGELEKSKMFQEVIPFRFEKTEKGVRYIMDMSANPFMMIKYKGRIKRVSSFQKGGSVMTSG